MSTLTHDFGQEILFGRESKPVSYKIVSYQHSWTLTTRCSCYPFPPNCNKKKQVTRYCQMSFGCGETRNCSHWESSALTEWARMFYYLICQKGNVGELVLQRKTAGICCLSLFKFSTLLLDEHRCFPGCPNTFRTLLIPRSECKITENKKQRRIKLTRLQREA